jgi:hypothetical protein
MSLSDAMVDAADLNSAFRGEGRVPESVSNMLNSLEASMKDGGVYLGKHLITDKGGKVSVDGRPLEGVSPSDAAKEIFISSFNIFNVWENPYGSFNDSNIEEVCLWIVQNKERHRFEETILTPKIEQWLGNHSGENAKLQFEKLMLEREKERFGGDCEIKKKCNEQISLLERSSDTVKEKEFDAWLASKGTVKPVQKEKIRR